MPRILPIETPSLGDRSYLVHDGRQAFVVDPQRDLDRVDRLLAHEKVAVAHVVETHIHNDYVTGGLALARRTGAGYYVNAADDVSFDRVGIRDGDLVTLESGLGLRAMATPGHTFTHLSYLLSQDDSPIAIFTGGSLLFGSTGRPDLLGPEHTMDLARRQHASARRLVDGLPDEVAIYPTHGFGSFCAATQSDATESTVGQERRSNPVLTTPIGEWVEQTLSALDVWPSYYVHMGPLNANGPDEADLSPVRLVDKDAIRASLAAGEWVVDLRSRRAFAAAHAPGSYHIEVDGQFATYLGWLMPWGTPLTLLGEDPDQVALAQRELARIGVDRLAGAATGGAQDWCLEPPAGYPLATFADLAQVRHHRAVQVLDVRQRKEWASGHLADAVNIPLDELLDRVHEVAPGETWVHCASGLRASTAASILDAAGIRVVAIDDKFDNARAAGLPMG